MKEVDRLWREHQYAAFPAGCRGEEIVGIDLVMLDADTAGSISAFLAQQGRLDSNHLAILQRCCDDLEAVEPQLIGDARAYFARLLELARLVVNTARQTGPTA